MRLRAYLIKYFFFINQIRLCCRCRDTSYLRDLNPFILYLKFIVYSGWPIKIAIIFYIPYIGKKIDYLNRVLHSTFNCLPIEKWQMKISFLTEKHCSQSEKQSLKLRWLKSIGVLYWTLSIESWVQKISLYVKKIMQSPTSPVV